MLKGPNNLSTYVWAKTKWLRGTASVLGRRHATRLNLAQLPSYCKGMTAIEPTEFDVVVVGTGLQEALVAGSAAKSSKRVLHLDPHSCYGSHWAGLSLDDLLAWAASFAESAGNQEQDVSVQSAAPIAPATTTAQAPCAQHEHVAVPSGPSRVYSSVELFRDGGAQLGASREYSIDLAPKVRQGLTAVMQQAAYCGGPMIQALLSCGAHNYLEFKLLQGSYIWSEGHLKAVPASRAEVFRDRSLGPADKRVLMRFLQNVASAIAGEGSLQAAFGPQPFVQLLCAEGLSPALRAFIMYSICLISADQESLVPESLGAGSPDASNQADVRPSGGVPSEPSADPGFRTASSQEGAGPGVPHPPQTAANGAHGPAQQLADGVDAASGVATARDAFAVMKRYIESAGRYGAGTGAYLVPMYGCGELPQAFCRIAAVAGALYVLRQPVDELLLDPSTGLCAGLKTSTGQVLTCKHLAAHPDILAGFQPTGPPSAPPHRRVSRAVCILDAPLQEGEHQLLVVMPPRALGDLNPAAVRALQVGPSTMVAPQNRYLLYVSTPSSQATAREDLQPAVEALVQVSPSLHTRQAVAVQPPTREPDTLMDIRPRALLVLYYNQTVGADVDVPANVACCMPPDAELGFASALQGAEEAYTKLFPGQQLFPVHDSAAAGDEESDEEAVEALEAVLNGLVSEGGSDS